MSNSEAQSLRKMRRPIHQTQQHTPDQRAQHTPDQIAQRTPDQTPERTPEQTPQGTPNQTPQGTPNQTPQGTPNQTTNQTPQGTPDQMTHQTPLILQNTPHQTPQQSPRQSPEPNMQNESSSANIDSWKVGSMHSDGRQRIEVIKRVLEPSGKCSSKTRGIMFERLEPRGFTWKEVSKETKMFYFEEFKSWIENWRTPEVQEKSVIKKKNRKGGVEGDGPYPGTHTSGSASHRLLATRLGDPVAPDLFTYAHTINHDNVTFVDPKSENLHKKIVSLRVERSRPLDGSSEPQPIDENQLYYEAVGGRNDRNRIYGLGSTQDIFYEPSSSAVAQMSSFQPNTQDYQKLQAELHEMKEKMKRMDEMEQQMIEMKSQIAMMFHNQN